MPDKRSTYVFLTLACLLVQAQTPPKAARDAFEKAVKAAQNKKTDEALRNYLKVEFARWCIKLSYTTVA